MKVYAIWDFYDMLEYSGGDEHLVGLVMTEEQASESCLRWRDEELRTYQLNGNDLDDLSIQLIKPEPDDPLKNGLMIEIKDKEADCVRYIRYEPIEVLDKPFPFGRIKSVLREVDSMGVWVVYMGYDYCDGSRDDWALDIYASEELAAETINNWVEWQKGIHEEGTYTIEKRELNSGSKWVQIRNNRDGSCEWIRYQRKLVCDFASKFIPD